MLLGFCASTWESCYISVGLICDKIAICVWWKELLGVPPNHKASLSNGVVITVLSAHIKTCCGSAKVVFITGSLKLKIGFGMNHHKEVQQSGLKIEVALTSLRS